MAAAAGMNATKFVSFPLTHAPNCGTPNSWSARFIARGVNRRRSYGHRDPDQHSTAQQGMVLLVVAWKSG